MIPTPDIGNHRGGPPHQALDAGEATKRGVMGATFGSHMWFHEDMVNALRNGATRAGWSASTDAAGRTIITLTTFGIRHRWAITGARTECPSMPGTWLYEGIWPD